MSYTYLQQRVPTFSDGGHHTSHMLESFLLNFLHFQYISWHRIKSCAAILILGLAPSLQVQC